MTNLINTSQRPFEDESLFSATKHNINTQQLINRKAANKGIIAGQWPPIVNVKYKY